MVRTGQRGRRSLLSSIERAYWGFDSRTWDDLLGDDHFLVHLDDVTGWLAAVLPDGGQVVDLGCGTGNYALALAKRGYRVLGLDFAPGALARAEQKRARLGLEGARFEE